MSAVVLVAATLIMFFVLVSAHSGGRLVTLAPIALILVAVAAFGYLAFGPQPD